MIDLSEIRPFNKTKDRAFEELCCQLAHRENIPNRLKFIRNGTPDGGVECFWILQGGEEICWQAKYFLSTPGKSQWKQIEDSINTAIKSHSSMKKYVICLPMDRANPKKDKETWFMDEWLKREKRWKEDSEKLGRKIEFDYWGSHEIIQRLQEENNRGIVKFWFDKELFTLKWFQNHISESIELAGHRYTPKLNVELPINKFFVGLCREPEFFNSLNKQWLEVKDALPRDATDLEQGLQKEIDKTNLVKKIDIISEYINQLEIDTKSIPFSEILSNIDVSLKHVDESLVKISNHLTQYDAEDWVKLESDKRYVATRSLEAKYRHLWSELLDFKQFCLSSMAISSNKNAMLIEGKAGVGKTHLLCDIAQKRVSEGYPTLLLHGGSFKDDEPWTQIVKNLGLSGMARDDLLGSLQIAAETSNSRALLMIDAINEGDGRLLWKRYLPGMLEVISRYPRICIALSVRATYKDYILKGVDYKDKFVEVEHHGFGESVYIAIDKYFNEFGIEYPSVPSLNPEFQNPLFLSLFCKGMKSKGLTKITPGLLGITSVFNLYLDHINDELASPERLDYSRREKIVYKAVECIINEMNAIGSDHLSQNIAGNKLSSILPRDGHEKSLYNMLVSEGLFIENCISNDDGTYEEVVSFGFERLFDHMRARWLLDTKIDDARIEDAFGKDGAIGKLMIDDSERLKNRGLIEALSIQVPERFGKELHEVAPYCASSYTVIEAFIDSLIWRDPKSINKKSSLSFINKHVINDTYTFYHFIDTLLTISLKEDHPFNAHFLHNRLKRMKMADRDAWWSTYLFKEALLQN